MSLLDENMLPAKRRTNTMWLTSLADLLALLLAFFVLVFAMNEIKRDTWEKVIDAIGNPLNLNIENEEAGPTAEKNVELFSEQRAFDLDYLENIISAKVANSEQLKHVEVFKLQTALLFRLLAILFLRLEIIQYLKSWWKQLDCSVKVCAM
ncbi:flagellar motor protein MotB [Sneathiella glossodoripedis]|uniref:flagellar motor protein MotB n=1 Tax=Sneathiella glossodoripedis TaxID=418853 RepID=UPI0004726891|nr:flagellar motor protein MotB [Sneathiella glossodoripedis]